MQNLNLFVFMCETILLLLPEVYAQQVSLLFYDQYWFQE